MFQKGHDNCEVLMASGFPAIVDSVSKGDVFLTTKNHTMSLPKYVRFAQ